MLTLEHFKEALLFKNQNLSSTPMPLVIGQLNKYMSKHNADASVEEGAIMFYLLNQAFGLLSMSIDHKADLTPEQEKLARMYLTTASESSARLFYYMLLITTREARHVKNSDSFFEKLSIKYGAEVVKFVKDLRSKSSDGAANALKGGSGSLANVTLGTYCACITDVFNTGSFSGGYGGKPWGNIANTLRKQVFGETSIEIMNDTAWTLAHNNGPMFNKGMLYKGYSNYIYKILDVQRAGMIPQLVTDGVGQYATSHVMTAYQAFKAVFPQAIEGYVDWVKVESLGSIHKYASEKKAQLQKYGKSQETLQAEATAPSKMYVNEYEYAVVLEKRVA